MTFQPLALIALLLAQNPASVGRGVIAGRIVQEDGTPAAGVRVAAIASNNASPDAMAILGLTESDANGRYRLEDIPAGRHLVAAGPFRALTYFPGVATPAEAQAIVVTDHSLQEGRDFRLLNRSLVLTVRGTVVRPSKGPEAPLSSSGVRFQDQIVLSSTLETVVASIAEDGSFEFQRIPAGTYQASIRMPGFTTYPITVVISPENASRLRFESGTVSGLPNTNGHFVVEGGGPIPRSVILKHSPAGVSFVPALTETPLIADASGAFKATITGVNGGRIVLQSTEPSAYSVSSVMFGDDDASTRRATVITGRELVVTFKSTGVKVTGSVTGGASLSADGRKVALIGTTSVPGTFPMSISRETVVGPDGQFTFSDVFRGSYEIRVAGAPGTPGTRVEVIDVDVVNVSVPGSQ